MTAGLAKRRVRITVEGDVVTERGKALRINYGAGCSLFVETSRDGVTVEDVARTRTWADGDVVQQSIEGWTLTRVGGRWACSMITVPFGRWTDELVTAHLDDTDNGWGHLVVLRYQAGEA